MRRRLSKGRRVAEDGFTLIELMISLVIFAILAAAGVALLANSVRADAVTGAKLDDSAALRRTFSLMEADFAQAEPRVTRGTDGRPSAAFLGGATSVQLVRGGWDDPDAAPRPSEQKALYRLNGDRLERLAFPQLDGAVALPPATLLDRLAGLTIRYRSHGAWTDSWPPVATGAASIPPLPDAVEWTLVRHAGGPIRAMFMIGAGAPPPPPEPEGAPGNAG